MKINQEDMARLILVASNAGKTFNTINFRPGNDAGSVGVRTLSDDGCELFAVINDESGAPFNEFSVCVDRLLPWLKMVKGGVSLTVTETKTVWRYKKSRVTMNVSTVEFPDSKLVDGVKMKINAESLMAALKKVKSSSGAHDVRYYLNGIFMTPEGDNLGLYASDGHRLAYSKALVDDFVGIDGGGFKSIVPISKIATIEKLCSECENIIEFEFDTRAVRVLGGGVQAVLSLVQGVFPLEVASLKNQLPGKMATVSLSSITRAASLVNVLAHKQEGIKLEQIDSNIRVSSSSQNKGTDLMDGEDYCQVESGEIKTTGVNGKYLLDALASIDSENVDIRVSDDGNKIMITDSPTREYVALIMGLRI